MIHVIFGDDQRESRLFLTTLIGEKKSTVYTDENLDLTTLAQSLGGIGLFGEKEVFVFENFLTRTKSQEKDAILDLVITHEKDNQIIFWEGKALNPSNIKSLPNAQIREFKHPQSLFQFLDSIRPGNSRSMVSLHRKTLLNMEEEVVFFMLVRQFRLMLAALQNAQIEEAKRLRPWLKDKLSIQARAIGTEKLKYSYSELFDIDKKQKTGELSSSLSTTIDFFLTSI